MSFRARLGFVVFGLAGSLLVAAPAQDDVDSYNRYRTIAGIGIIGGTVLAGAGAVLLFTAPKSERQVSVRATLESVAVGVQF